MASEDHQVAPAAADLEALAGEAYCYLMTVGRCSGADHTIEIWFATDGGSLYLISGGGDHSDWVRNLRASPRARVRVADTIIDVTATAPLALGARRDEAVRQLHGKYGSQVSGSLQDWQRDAYIVALNPSPTS